jgi:hypothetical protein
MRDERLARRAVNWGGYARILTACSLIALTLLTGACNFFAQPSDIQAENLQSEIARTQIAAIRATATTHADRLAVTAEYAMRAMGDADLQGTRIAATLIALGTPFVEVPFIPGMAMVQPILPTPAAVEPLFTAEVLAQAPPLSGAGIPTSDLPVIANPLITPGVGARGGVTLGAPTPTPLAGVPASNATPDPNAPTVTDIVVAARVGANDCAINPSTSFSLGVADLYVVGTARNITPGTRLTSRWTRDGAEVAFYEWTPNFAINGACIWFHAPGAQVPLAAGSWAVQMTVNGVPIGTPVTFTITG